MKKFRALKLCRKSIEALGDHAQSSKIEREKETYKTEMWSKVNGWLTQLDKKD